MAERRRFIHTIGARAVAALPAAALAFAMLDSLLVAAAARVLEALGLR